MIISLHYFTHRLADYMPQKMKEIQINNEYRDISSQALLLLLGSPFQTESPYRFTWNLEGILKADREYLSIHHSSKRNHLLKKSKSKK